MIEPSPSLDGAAAALTLIEDPESNMCLESSAWLLGETIVARSAEMFGPIKIWKRSVNPAATELQSSHSTAVMTLLPAGFRKRDPPTLPTPPAGTLNLPPKRCQPSSDPFSTPLESCMFLPISGATC